MTRGSDSLGEFYRATGGQVIGLLITMGAPRALAEDLTQEAFVRLLPRWERVQRYESPEAWVRGAAVRLLVSHARREEVARRFLPFLRKIDPVMSAPSDRLAIEEGFRRLPTPQRVVAVMYYVLDLPLEEIAAAVGVPVGTVKSRLHRARAALLEHLSAEERS